MSLILYIGLFVIGLVAIIKGADWLTDGAAAIARRLGVPTIVVGMTIVAIGSSLPEFVVSVTSAIKGNAGMAVGNVVGSNIFNILIILGLTAAIRPLDISRTSVRNDVPYSLLSSIVLGIVAMSGCIERSEGLLLLCFFAIFISYTLSLSGNATPTVNGGEEADEAPPAPASWGRSALLCAGGLAALLLGGNWLVDGGAGSARILGMSESLIALTFISIGTSAPELAASVMAARKGDHGMALGNVVGSVVFNVFFVLGTAATISPLTLEDIGPVHLLVLAGSSVVLWLFCFFGQKTYVLSRAEGSLMLLAGLAYYIWLALC